MTKAQSLCPLWGLQPWTLADLADVNWFLVFEREWMKKVSNSVNRNGTLRGHCQGDFCRFYLFIYFFGHDGILQCNQAKCRMCNYRILPYMTNKSWSIWRYDSETAQSLSGLAWNTQSPRVWTLESPNWTNCQRQPAGGQKEWKLKSLGFILWGLQMSVVVIRQPTELKTRRRI